MSDQDFSSPPPEGLPPVPPPSSAGSPPPPPPSGGGGSYGGSASASGLPWDERQSHGFVPALVETLKLLVTAPQEAFDRMRKTGDLVSPILWVAILGLVLGLLRYIVGLAFGAGNPLEMLPAEMREQMGPMASMAAGGGATIVSVILAPIFAVIGMFIWGGILHLALMLVGGLTGSNSGFDGTFRVASYSYVGSLPSFVPIIGGLVSLVWTVFLLVVGISKTHNTTQGKALTAVLIPALLCCLCAIALAVIAGIGIAGMAGAAAQ